MTAKADSLRRLRGGRRWMLALLAPIVAGGLIYTWWAAARASVPQSLIGAAVALAALGAGALWSMVLQERLLRLRVARRMIRLERQINSVTGDQGRLRRDIVESAQQARDTIHELASRSAQQHRRLAERFEGLLARVETFSKLHDEQADRLERRLSALESAVRRGVTAQDARSIEDTPSTDWADQSAPPGERTVAAYHHLIGSDGPGESVGGVAAPADRRELRRTLRLEFASFIHKRDYVSALAKGDQIVSEFPDSTAAADFRRVRPHLLRRIELSGARGKAGV